MRLTSKSRDRAIASLLADIRQEIRIMKHLETHPYIVTLYGIAFQNLNPILVVELAISGLPTYLLDHFETQRRVDWSVKAQFCAQVADGLHALHKVDIVHGDIKGDNILLFPNPVDNDIPVAKISDFGYSSSIVSIHEGRGTGGTQNFLAPENTPSAPDDMREFDNSPTKDNYSYGLFVWQVAMDGEVPFNGMTGDEIDELKHDDKELKVLMSQLDDVTPEEFRLLIVAMTRYKPEDRASLEDVRDILKSEDNTEYVSWHLSMFPLKPTDLL